MDTLALNLNLGTIAASAATGAEGVLPDSTESTGVLDFAALLAAGLDVAQANAHALAGVPSPSETTALHEPDATPEPAPDALAAVTQGMPQIALLAMPTQAGGPAADLQGTAAQSAASRRADPQGPATSIAADTAILAAPTSAPGSPSSPASPSSPSSLFASEGNAAAAAREQPHAEIAFTAEIAKRESEQIVTAQDNPIAETTGPSPLFSAAIERPAAPQATALLEIGAPVSGPGFADALSRQVVWMVDKDAQVAELRINPPELGPVEVRLTLAGDEASAQFVSTHAEVRNAIEASLGRLREAMAQAGIQLGEATVSAESFRDQSTAQEGQGESRRGYRTDAAESAPHWPAGSARASVSRGLIDVFA